MATPLGSPAHWAIVLRSYEDAGHAMNNRGWSPERSFVRTVCTNHNVLGMHSNSLSLDRSLELTLTRHPTKFWSDSYQNSIDILQ